MSCLLLRCGLLLRGLLGLGSGSGLLLLFGGELIGRLELGEVAVGNHLLQDTQERGIQPLLIGREIGLHVLLDGDGGEPVRSLSSVMTVMIPALYNMVMIASSCNGRKG